MSKTKTKLVKKKTVTKKPRKAKEVKVESQTEKFIFEDVCTKKYAQVHDYESADSVRVIPRKKGDTWDILALSTKELNLDRLDKALSADRGYTLVTRKIIVDKERAPVILQDYKEKLETEFPKDILLKRIEAIKKKVESS